MPNLEHLNDELDLESPAAVAAATVGGLALDGAGIYMIMQPNIVPRLVGAAFISVGAVSFLAAFRTHSALRGSTESGQSIDEN